MSGCCGGGTGGETRTWGRRARELVSWVVPGAILVLVPKCPACLAAYVLVWTGLGLSLTTATYLRRALLVVGVASLIVLMVKRVARVRAVFGYFNGFFKKETEPCRTKS